MFKGKAADGKRLSQHDYLLFRMFSRSFKYFLAASTTLKENQTGSFDNIKGLRRSVRLLFPISLVFSIGLGVVLRLAWIGKREFWYDEVLSVLLSTGQKSAYRNPSNVPFSLSAMAGLLRLPTESGLGDSVETVETLLRGNLSEPHPPLLYLITHGWMRLFGNSELSVRSSILLMSVGAITTAYFLGRRILGVRGGLIFAALLSLNPFFLSHSLNLRMYSPLVLWALLSALCLFILMGVDRSEFADLDFSGLVSSSERVLDSANERSKRFDWLLRVAVAGSLAAGVMTQYLFAYWFFALAAIVLFLDRRCWLSHGLTLAAGGLLFLPWALWGTLRQLSNRADVIERISTEGSSFSRLVGHGRDLAQTLADYLLIGHLPMRMPPLSEPIKPMAVAIGCWVIGFAVWCVVSLFRKRQYWVLWTCFLLGFFPLLLALGVDVLANKNTLGFGFGRATIVVLPGCVLMVAAWLEKATGRWREALSVGVLMAYLAVNVVDFVGSDRNMFHQVNASLLSGEGSTLVVMNSRAWGHVNRLVYYLDETANPDVLATKPVEVKAALSKALESKSYERVLWLRSNYPLWDAPEDETEVVRLALETDRLLQGQYSLLEEQSLRGTMALDSFELQVYQREAMS